ncbi:type II/IV secretion system protein [Candidatus Nomurabacteria bacterium]|nr:type II/IV secretion system protein [Candidatus Nomurabacteria bacterium]
MLLDFFLSQNIITEAQYNAVLGELDTKYDHDPIRALVAHGVSEDSLTQAKAAFYKMPYRKIKAGDITYDTLKYIEEDAARHYKFLPLSFADSVLSVGVTEPENIESMNALQFISSKVGVPFKLFLVSLSDFLAGIENYKALTSEVAHSVSELNTELEMANQELSEEKKGGKKNEESAVPDEKIVEDAPIIKIMATIIDHAVGGSASDIHIENTGSEVRVRYRVDGILKTALTLPLAAFDGVVARVKILSKLRLDEKRRPQDGSFATMIEGRKVEFRVSTFPAYYGEKVVMRILDSERGVKSLEDLDLSQEHLTLLKTALAKPYGMILISGPTGSGKSTTLYSMLSAVDREGENVVSLEDPVEYQIPGVTQSQVMPEIGYTFAAGLRSILRQDPNIIMVGEIRDKETAALAIQAALTGHLVFSTIHTNNSVGIVPRLIDMGVDPYLIAPTLILAMAQRLVRRVHPDARTEVPIDESTKAFITQQFSTLPEAYKNKVPLMEKMFKITPTTDLPSGTKGRVAVFEMFAIDVDIQEMILKNPVEPELAKLVRSKGMLTLREDALIKSLAGIVPMQEVYGL